jgi:tetratricopeptide (TPR) repeat protein
MMRSTIFVALSAVALTAVAQADTIHFNSGRKSQGGVTVLDEKLDVVEYRIKGVNQKQTIPSSEVAKVDYEDPGNDYKSAQDALDAAGSKDDYKSAAEQFLAVYTDLKNKGGLQALALMNAADALERAGERKKALETYDKLATDLPQSRYAALAILEKGRGLAFSSDAKGARAAFLKLKEMGERWSLMADLQVQILDEAANPTAALETYKKISTQAGKYPDVANLAKLQIGRGMFAAKQYAEAEANFRSILDNRAASTRDIQAGAWNGLGASLAAKDKATADDLRKSLFAHLRVITQFDDIIDEQPEALYRAGKTFLKVPSTDAAARSKQLLGRCQKEFAGTQWAKLASQG